MRSPSPLRRTLTASPGDRAVDDLGFDDVLFELRGLGEGAADGRVVEVVPVPDVLEERRLVALEDSEMSRQIEIGREQAEDGRGDVDQRQSPLRQRVGVSAGRDVPEGRREEPGERVVMHPRQVEDAADDRERGEDDERRRHHPRRLVRVVTVGVLAESLGPAEGQDEQSAHVVAR